MSSTRHAAEGSPLAYERFMSHPVYAERRPLPGNIVLEKAAGYASSATRRLLFFVQALSMEPGGLQAVAADLCSQFPEVGEMVRIAKIGMLPPHQREWAQYLASGMVSPESVTLSVSEVHAILVDLCINPSLDLDAIGGMLGVVERYRLRRIKNGEAHRVITSGGQIIHSALDRVLASRRMEVVEAPAGFGKSHSAHSWCASHTGEARLVSLSGITHRTGFFQKLGAAFGIVAGHQASSKLQAKVESFVASSGLMVVFDEAHYLWPQHRHSQSSPELVDWVNTALVNQGVPVALLCTDQFAKLKARVEKQTGWTSDQFIHRTFRYTVLTDRPTKAELEAVTRCLLSMRWVEEQRAWEAPSSHNASAAAIKTIVGYAGANPLPLPTAKAIVDDARCQARGAGRDYVTAADVAEAISEQQRSDVNIRKAFNGSRKVGVIYAEIPPSKPTASASHVSPPPSEEEVSFQQMSRLSAVRPTNHSSLRSRSSPFVSA